MDIIQFYIDYNVPFQTEGHKHCRVGWVNTECPYCSGNPGLHLGFEIITNHFVCWRCGWHPIVPTLSALTGLSFVEIKKIINNYDDFIPHNDLKISIKKKSFKLPTGLNQLQNMHIKYLINRNFDPEYIIKTFSIMGLGNMSYLHVNNTTIDYRFRLFIPYFWGSNEMVSFDSRDITNKNENKYKACPIDRELIPRKSILYGRPDKWKETGVCVEGPTDVWRLGIYSFAVSGIKYTNQQVRAISKLFKRVFVLFDGRSQTSKEEEAEHKAFELCAELKFRKVDAIYVPLEGDPGDLPQEDANYLIKHLIK